MATGGISDAHYNLGGYSDGGRLLRGPGDGVSDSIPATIGNNYGQQLNNSTNNSRWSTIRAGANYHLNFDKAVPVIAKY